MFKTRDSILKNGETGEEQEAVKTAEEVAMKEPLMSNSTSGEFSTPYRESNKNKNNSGTKEFNF